SGGAAPGLCGGDLPRDPQRRVGDVGRDLEGPGAPLRRPGPPGPFAHVEDRGDEPVVGVGEEPQPAERDERAVADLHHVARLRCQSTATARATALTASTSRGPWRPGTIAHHDPVT